MAVVQFYPDTTVFSAPSSSTFNTGPSSDIIGGRFGVSSFHDSSSFSAVFFFLPAHRVPDERTVKTQIAFCFLRALVFVSRATLFLSWLDRSSGARPPL